MVRLLRDSCEQVAKRLNLHTATNKQHIKCCDTCLQCKDGLIFDGGTLRHECICVEEKHHSVWLVQHLVNSASCGNTVNEIAHTLSRFAERGLWSPISCLWTGTSDLGL